MQEYNEYDYLFYFYRDGLKGLVEDIIIHSASWEFHKLDCKHDEKPAIAKNVIDKMLMEYEYTPEGIINNITNNTMHLLKIEIIATMLDNAINEMMYCIFQKNIYHISNINIRWLNNDLIIDVLKINKDDT
jgi:hypothetical protein